VLSEEKRRHGGLAETIRSMATALVVALVVRTLLFQAFSIPSGSMEATLLVGD
jgi:signal peptidase I